MYEFNYPGLVFGDSQADPNSRGPTPDELKVLGERIGESFTWLKEGDVEGDWQKNGGRVGEDVIVAIFKRPAYDRKKRKKREGLNHRTGLYI